MNFPHYSLVPKDMDANLRFRRGLLEMGRNDAKAAEELRLMCARDYLFFINAFLWTYDPRKTPSELPFITYDFQDEAFSLVFDLIGKDDGLVEKSRDMGATWIFMTAFACVWQWRDMSSFLVASRKEEYVDKPGDPKTLFWKSLYLIDNQPGFLKPRFDRRKLHLENMDNGSVIDGESTTGDVGRGDRRTAVLIDEFSAVEVSDGYRLLSSTRDVTRSRFFNFTPRGTGNAAYDMAQTEIRKVRMHWSQHPDKNPGLYTSDEQLNAAGQSSGVFTLRIIDQAYEFPEGYKFVLDGRQRSPWYDKECRRCATESEIAQELDINYLGSGYQYFDEDVLRDHRSAFCVPPVLRGDVDFNMEDAGSPEFVHNPGGGPLMLWIYLDSSQRPPADRDYVIGCDISAGTNASNSSGSIADLKTGEKVAEYTISSKKPHEFAKICVALARFFKGPDGTGAYLGWEANGPGREFGDKVVELGYRHIYYRKNDRSVSRKQSDIPGWFSTKESKISLLGEYRADLKDKYFINHSLAAIEEAKEYVHGQDGSIIHAKSANSVDPSGAKENHGDRVIADAVANKLRRERVQPSEEASEEAIIPTESIGGRRRVVEQAVLEARYEW